jgi:prophage regulatory protein
MSNAQSSSIAALHLQAPVGGSTPDIAGRETQTRPRRRRAMNDVPLASATTGNASERLLPMKAVVAITSWSRTSINRLIQKGDFPTPLKLGPQKIAFRESEVRAWVASRERRVSATPETDEGVRP